MPPKRKRPEEASQPALEPRRSSRRVKEVADGAHTTVPVKSNGRARGARKASPDDVIDRRDEISQGAGLEKAVKELSQMEEKFASDLKQQRLAVESSDLVAETTEPGDRPFEPNLLKARKGVINDGPADEPGEIERAPQDEYQAELAEGDMTQAKMEEEKGDRGAKRPPPVNSAILPLPWKGRLGYACLNTYLRNATPPVFSSRTCRIASIIEHRHPLKDPSQPEHPTKNRPDRDQPADIERGMKYAQDLGVANARDIPKMLRWNDKYGIKFMRLSSEMFPFASHHEHGYKLESFASEALAEAGKVAAELGHRLTTHPGQFTQIGSPRKEVVTAAIRDLEYHAELLSLLKLPDQLDRDAVMILHLGGVYGDKQETLKRFKENYKALPEGVKKRMVLENDDVSWSVHDLLPVCEELNIPMVLDFHHHNIVFDGGLREGSHDILSLFDRIKATWTRKGITQKMHYSEQTSGAVTPRERRKHSARVKTLPPCGAEMDLMIEAKDKEQAVFELMRTFKLPGWDTFNDVVPHEREDENRKAVKKKGVKKSKKKAATNGEVSNPDDDIEIPERIVSEEDFAMGGPEDRVYWPEGMEEWLRPKKREIIKKTPTKAKNGPGGNVKMEIDEEEEEDDD